MNDATNLKEKLGFFREAFEKAWCDETALPGSLSDAISCGQCASTSIVLQQFLGGELVSTKVDGISHWFNRIKYTKEYDVDITGDQFGRPAIQIAAPGLLYPSSRIRHEYEINSETIARARILFRKLNGKGIKPSLSCLSEKLMSSQSL